MAVLNQIKKFIERRKISRYRFWQDTGLGRDTAYRLCNDPSYVPTGNVLDKICGTYKVQPGEILVWMPDDEAPAAIAELEKSQDTGQEQQPNVRNYDKERKLRSCTWKYGCQNRNYVQEELIVQH